VQVARLPWPASRLLARPPNKQLGLLVTSLFMYRCAWPQGTLEQSRALRRDPAVHCTCIWKLLSLNFPYAWFCMFLHSLHRHICNTLLNSVVSPPNYPTHAIFLFPNILTINSNTLRSNSTLRRLYSTTYNITDWIEN